MYDAAASGAVRPPTYAALVDPADSAAGLKLDALPDQNAPETARGADSAYYTSPDANQPAVYDATRSRPETARGADSVYYTSPDADQPAVYDATRGRGGSPTAANRTRPGVAEVSSA